MRKSAASLKTVEYRLNKDHQSTGALSLNKEVFKFPSNKNDDLPKALDDIELDQDEESNSSDDTVKLEDFQEAQNDSYHNDILQAIKSQPKSSFV